MLDLRATALSPEIIDDFLAIERHHLETGKQAWGDPYTDPKWFTKIPGNPFADNLFMVPVSSNGIGQYLLMIYARLERGCNRLLFPSNTFEGIKSTYRLNHYPIQEYNSALDGMYESTLNPGILLTPNDCLIQTPIGGYKWVTRYPLRANFHILDGAHAHFMNYEEKMPDLNAAIVYSFFPTKSVNIGGDAGLIVTKDERLYNWLIKAVMYDKPFFMQPSLNARISQANAYKIMHGFSDPKCVKWFREDRVKIVNLYKEICSAFGVDHLTNECNGYKFIITDPRIKDVDDLVTSRVFDRTDYHICPATYAPLASQLDELDSEFTKIIRRQI